MDVRFDRACTILGNSDIRVCLPVEHHKAAIEEQIELLQSEKDKLCFVA
jgi:hypothetical protein